MHLSFFSLLSLSLSVQCKKIKKDATYNTEINFFFICRVLTRKAIKLGGVYTGRTNWLDQTSLPKANVLFNHLSTCVPSSILLHISLLLFTHTHLIISQSILSFLLLLHIEAFTCLFFCHSHKHLNAHRR